MKKRINPNCDGPSHDSGLLAMKTVSAVLTHYFLNPDGRPHGSSSEDGRGTKRMTISLAPRRRISSFFVATAIYYMTLLVLSVTLGCQA